EIEIASYIATNNIPISSVDGLVALVNRISVMKGVPGNLGMTRKKCSNIINNVLGEKQSQDLSQNLNNNKFSVLVDYSASKLYEAFESSFEKQSIEQKTKSAIDIYDGFTNDELRSYLLFLEFSLDTFNKFNALFQSRETQIHIIVERSESILKQMAMCFLKPDAMNNITINSMAPVNTLPTLSIKVGDNCQNLLNTLDNFNAMSLEILVLLFIAMKQTIIILSLHELVDYCEQPVILAGDFNGNFSLPEAEPLLEFLDENFSLEMINGR
ncbi:hypothetical protein PV328_011827, partial [Microctonus aethiopoides]